MDSSLLLLFCVGLMLRAIWAASHSLRYFHTAMAGSELEEPRFISVGYVDDVEFIRFDSSVTNSRAEPRAQWMERMVLMDPEYWEQETWIEKKNSGVYQVNLETLRANHNQSQGGVHTFQTLLGCEVSPDGTLQHAFYQFAYNGQEYLALNAKTWTWTAWAYQTQNSKHEWEAERSLAERYKVCLKFECQLWLDKYLEIGKEALTRKDPPSARITRHIAHDGEVTLRCRAQDFYPSKISLIWLRDGEEQLQDTKFIETRPGGDGTFQKWAAVVVTPGQEGRYTCRVQHEGLTEPLILKWESPSSSIWTILGVIIGVLLPAVVIGVVIWRIKNPAPRRDVPAVSPKEASHNKWC
ncbi:RLA class I histocompatibility antigen, alpha chain 11/11-like isoform X2 [Macrotis lagotis]|uniref:RLA class I histocompatibility antigen, alpha chain 11/11-like isoform X2 n=1 Tax=Macrotis lagotis TaxID=92651 RepID=UPI003D68B4E1